MKVQYKFEVYGRTRTQGVFPLQANGVAYDVETDKEGVIKSISLTYQVRDKGQWPIFTVSPEPGIAANVVMHSPCIELAQRDIRTAEGILSFFGVQQIPWHNPEEIYIPDSEEEERNLAIHSMKYGRQKLSPQDLPPISFDIVARALMRARNLTNYEVPLAFFRRGKNDVEQDRHIEACLDYLFMLETLFANGKFKTAQVKEQYASSEPLTSAISLAVCDTDLPRIATHRGQQHYEALSQRYLSKSPHEIAKSFVDLRGRLHHHSEKGGKTWHPDSHDEFFVDALVLGQVCFRVAFELISKDMFSKDAEREYFSNYNAAMEGARHT